MKISLSILSMLLLAGHFLYGQEQPTLREKAYDYFVREEYSLAISLYNRLATRKNPKPEDIEHLAQCYKRNQQYEDAENWYARLYQENPQMSGESLVEYVEVLMNNRKYEEGADIIRGNQSAAGNEILNRLLVSCDSAKNWMARPTPHKIENVEGINTGYSEWGAVPFEGGLAYSAERTRSFYSASIPVSHNEQGYNTYKRTGRPYTGLFRTYRDTGRFQEYSLTAHINQLPYHKGTVALSPSGDTLYFTRTVGRGHPVKMFEDAFHKYRLLDHQLELLYMTRDSSEWQVPRVFPYNNVEEYSTGHPALNTRGDLLYFVSDRTGGQGGMDIWYCLKGSDGNWATPRNAGAVINTPGDEMFPTVGLDGGLYFSSDGHPSFGGLDIFKAEGDEEQWTAVSNMGYPVNSPKDDFYLVEETSASGYFSSDRSEGKGFDDIYRYTLPERAAPQVICVYVEDKETGESISGAKVKIFQGENKLLYATQTTSYGGETCFIPSEIKGGFAFEASKQLYLDGEKTIPESDLKGDTVKVVIPLESLAEVGKTFVLENIYYDFDKWNIRPDAAAELDELVDILRDNPTIRIELSSHTDSRGSHSYNRRLSQRRAESAVEYLISKGIAADRMEAQGYGESRLVNGCADGVDCSEEAHQDNRRTEFTILSY